MAKKTGTGEQKKSAAANMKQDERKKVSDRAKETVEENQRREAEAAKPKMFTSEQMKEILSGVRGKLDTKVYANAELSSAQMKELRLGLEAELDVSKYNSPQLSADYMKQMRMGMKQGLDMGMLVPEEGEKSPFTSSQAKEIRLGLENGQDVLLYAKPEFNAEQMKELRLGQKNGLTVEDYANASFSAEQMNMIRKELTMQQIIERIKEMIKDLYEKVRSFLSLENEALPENEQLEQPELDALVEEKVRDILSSMYRDLEKTMGMDEMSVEQQAEVLMGALATEPLVNRYISIELTKPQEQTKAMETEYSSQREEMMEEEIEEEAEV